MAQIVVGFASAYQQMFPNRGADSMKPIDFLYYSVLTFVGNGTITPISRTVEIFSLAETALGYLMSSVVIALIVNALFPILSSERRKTNED